MPKKIIDINIGADTMSAQLKKLWEIRKLRPGDQYYSDFTIKYNSQVLDLSECCNSQIFTVNKRELLEADLLNYVIFHRDSFLKYKAINLYSVGGDYVALIKLIAGLYCLGYKDFYVNDFCLVDYDQIEPENLPESRTERDLKIPSEYLNKIKLLFTGLFTDIKFSRQQSSNKVLVLSQHLMQENGSAKESKLDYKIKKYYSVMQWFVFAKDNTDLDHHKTKAFFNGTPDKKLEEAGLPDVEYLKFLELLDLSKKSSGSHYIPDQYIAFYDQTTVAPSLVFDINNVMQALISSHHSILIKPLLFKPAMDYMSLVEDLDQSCGQISISQGCK